MHMKIGIAGCKTTTTYLIKSLLSYNLQISNIISIDQVLGEKNKVADYCNLTPLAKNNNIPIYNTETYSLKSENDKNNISKMKLDILFVIGWQRLIPKWFLQILKVGAFGMHGSSEDLPKGRGRSPMNWSIIEGRHSFTTNLFKYDEGVDSGNIVAKYKFNINKFDTAETCHYKNMIAMKMLIHENINALLTNSLELIPQKDITPTYYPKRNPEDSLIDWEHDITVIHRFIRAVTKPFNGAFTFNHGNVIRIWRAEIFDKIIYDYDNECNGVVVEVFENGKFLVKVKGGLLIIHDYEGKVNIFDILNNGDLSIKQFPRNNKGFYDVEA